MPVDDLNQIFGDKLREAGLAVDHVEMDGLLHRSGTSAKAGGKDGAYIAHADSPVSVWWQNWQTGEDGTYCPVKKSHMSAAERDTLKKRIAEARARREAEEKRRHGKPPKPPQRAGMRLATRPTLTLILSAACVPTGCACGGISCLSRSMMRRESWYPSRP